MDDQEHFGLNRIDDLKRLEQDIENWAAWLKEGRPDRAKSQWADRILKALQANREVAESMQDAASPPELIRQRCDELESQVYDTAHRYGLRLERNRGRG